MPFTKTDSGLWTVDKDDMSYATWDALHDPVRNVYVIVITDEPGNGDMVDQVVKELMK